MHLGQTENIQWRESDVPQSELTTNGVEDAVSAVSDKYRTSTCAYKDSAVFAIIDLHLIEKAIGWEKGREIDISAI